MAGGQFIEAADNLTCCTWVEADVRCKKPPVAGSHKHSACLEHKRRAEQATQVPGDRPPPQPAGPEPL